MLSFSSKEFRVKQEIQLSGRETRGGQKHGQLMLTTRDEMRATLKKGGDKEELQGKTRTQTKNRFRGAI